MDKSDWIVVEWDKEIRIRHIDTGQLVAPFYVEIYVGGKEPWYKLFHTMDLVTAEARVKKLRFWRREEIENYRGGYYVQ